MMKVRVINSKDETKILNYVSQAISKFNSNSLTLSGRNIFEYDDLMYALGHLIEIDGYSSNIKQKRGFINSAVKRAKSYKKISIYNFLKRIEVEVRSFEKKPIRKFIFVYPVNISSNSLALKRSFTINNTKIYVRNRNFLFRHFDCNTPQNEISSLKPTGLFPSLFSYFVVEEDARTQDEALHNSNEKIDLLLSLFNFCESFKRITWVLIGEPKSFSKFLPSKYIYFYDSNKKYLNYGYHLADYKLRNERVSERTLKNVEKVIKSLNKLKQNELKELLRTCFLTFNDALSERNRGFVFLKFWQVLEFIALKDDKNKVPLKTVKKRIQSFFKSNTPLYEIIETLYRKRNSLVHSGNFADIEQDDLNNIKTIAETAILFLWNRVNKYETKQKLNHYFRLQNTNTTELINQKKIMESILRSRSI